MRGALVAAIGLAIALAGCRQDMHDAPRVDPLEKSAFFADGLSARAPVEGSVPRGFLRLDEAFARGKVDGRFVTEIPVEVTSDLLARGRDRFDVYCSPCHDRVGGGNGMIVRRGLRQPASYHIDRLREAPPGYFMDVITNGFGVMQDYAAQLEPRDRWAVVAYIRALQLSQNAPVARLAAEDRARLDEGAPR